MGVNVGDQELRALFGILLLDEERCVRCALCIERCPPAALFWAE